MLKFISFVFINLLVSSAWATNYLNENETCLKTSDLKKIQRNFPQLSNMTNTRRPVVCLEKDLSKRWFNVARDLLALETLKNSPIIKRDVRDDFTLSPIVENNWWEYFTKRANRFVFHPEYCDKNPSVIAYVNRNKKGIINLCNKFFAESLTSQVSILMHEVRHFDGFSHVECTRGAETGSAGACDEKIKDAGSYAVSVQVNVGLSKSNQITEEERALLESLSVYYINNKFNSSPNVRFNEMIYLSNAEGKVYKANARNLGKTIFVAKLKSPAKIYSNSSVMTFFPLNKEEKAYRLTGNFKKEVKEVGAFAKKYNEDSASDRELYTGFSYLDTGFALKDNTLYSFCSEDNLQEFKHADLRAKAAIDLVGARGLQAYAQNENGDLFAFRCDLIGKKGTISKTKYNIPMEVLGSVGLKNGSNYILNDKGEFLKINLETREITETKLPLNKWISVTSRDEYVIFE